MAALKSILIRGGQIITEGSVSQQDLLIQGETISSVGRLSDVKADEKWDVDGLLVLPGGVDTHVHFNDEFMGTVSVHDYETGTRAAAYGGTTTVIDFSNQWPGGSLHEALEKKHEEARDLALIDWGVHPVITRPDPETLDEIPDIVKSGAPTIKCYMTYRDEGIMIEPPDLRRILSRLKQAGGMLMVHAEDNDLAEENISRLISGGNTSPIYHARSKPCECENRAITRGIEIAKETGGRLFVVHLASDEGIRLIASARDRGVDVLAETCTHYLVFTEEALEREDGIKWICSPPLRNSSVQKALWEGIGDGRICQVSSDDAAFSWKAKLLGKNRFDQCPNGLPGVETRVPLMYSEGVAKGRISLPRLVHLISANPARIFGLYPKKGCLLPGSDADIVLLDPNKSWTLNQSSHHMATDWSPFEDWKITGKIVKVFSRGEPIIDGGECLAERGRGLYVPRKLYR